ncbi:MAG: N-carbamoyl-L-amino acid hydrolase [Ilumatobacteraceae bacterium]|nr:N-carbamoyl-L-amino acid hydrolase [Ilumatobacteraceae bacterium]
MTSSNPSIDAATLADRLREMASVGASATGGVTRLAFSAADVAARTLAAAWMTEAGLEVELDAATNLIGRIGPAPTQAAIVLGSHLDTVPSGGHLDGAYGVLAAIEVAAALRRAGHRLRHPLWVVAFANEEGVDTTPPFTGSFALVGAPVDLGYGPPHGQTVAQRIQAAGGRPDDLASAAAPAGAVAAYVELHIEQGPSLDAAGVPIGVVTGIAGRRTFTVELTGAANHAGTTPMGARADALCTAAEIVLAIESLAADGAVAVATVGSLEIAPNAANVIPGSARFTVEMRDIDDERLDRADGDAQQGVHDIAARRGVTAVIVADPPRLAVPADPTIAATIERVAEQLGQRTMRLFSGAGHDAQVMARICPMGMVFVPSRDGISHSPHEHTDLDQLVCGADALLHTVLALDQLDEPIFRTASSPGAR